MNLDLPALVVGSRLHDEVVMAKAALLYADRVELASLVLGGLGGCMMPFEEFVRREGVMRCCDERFRAADFLDARQEDPVVHVLRAVLGDEGDDVACDDGPWGRSQLGYAVQIARLCELGPAARLGLVDFVDDQILDPIASMDAARGVLEGRHRGVPVVDDWTASSARSRRLDERAFEGFLATHLLSEMPAFPRASVDDILDVRGRLGTVRTRFRGAMAELAATIRDRPEDEYLDIVEDLSRRLVAPAIAEIDEKLRELGALPTLLRVASDRITAATVTATLAVAASGFQLAGIAGAIASAPTIAATAKELRDRREINRAAARSPYWLLRAADHRLGLLAGTDEDWLRTATKFPVPDPRVMWFGS